MSNKIIEQRLHGALVICARQHLATLHTWCTLDFYWILIWWNEHNAILFAVYLSLLVNLSCRYYLIKKFLCCFLSSVWRPALCFLQGAVIMKEWNKCRRIMQTKLSLMDLITALPQTSKNTSPTVLSVAQQICSWNRKYRHKLILEDFDPSFSYKHMSREWCLYLPFLFSHSSKVATVTQTRNCLPKCMTPIKMTGLTAGFLWLNQNLPLTSTVSYPTKTSRQHMCQHLYGRRGQRRMRTTGGAGQVLFSLSQMEHFQGTGVWF